MPIRATRVTWTGSAATAILLATLTAGTPGLAVPRPAVLAFAVEAIRVQFDPNYRPHHRRSGGYRVNRMGYGNYTRGADGGFGGYPAGSDGAKILQDQQRRKCQAVPESC